MSKLPDPPSGFRRQPDGSWTNHPGPRLPIPSKRCVFIIDEGTESERRCRGPRTKGADMCNAHGPDGEEWQRNGAVAGGEATKEFWASRKRLAATLDKARSWDGYVTLCLAAIREQYAEMELKEGGTAYVALSDKALAAYMQRLEKGLEHTAKDEAGGGDMTIILGDPDASGL